MSFTQSAVFVKQWRKCCQ